MTLLAQYSAAMRLVAKPPTLGPTRISPLEPSGRPVKDVMQEIAMS